MNEKQEWVKVALLSVFVLVLVGALFTFSRSTESPPSPSPSPASAPKVPERVPYPQYEVGGATGGGGFPDGALEIPEIVVTPEGDAISAQLELQQIELEFEALDTQQAAKDLEMEIIRPRPSPLRPLPKSYAPNL